MEGSVDTKLLLIQYPDYRHGPRLRNYTRYAVLCQGDETYNENSSLLSFDAILGNGVNQNGFGPGPDDPNRPSEIYSTAFVEETSFAHAGWDATPLPSAVALIEIAPAQESVWPSFTALRRFFHQTLERFHTYLRELLSQLGLGDGRQDHTKPREIHFSDKLETVVEETSFAHDGRDATPLPSAVALIEIAPAQESIWPSFTTLRRFFHQTLERFHTYLRELLSQLGLGDGQQDHTKPREIHFSDKLETVVEETSFAHDGRDATPLPSAVALIEIAPAQQSIWPSFTALRRFFHQTLERFHTYLRELLSQLGLGDGQQDHTKPREIHFSDKLETVVEETSFAHDGRDATPLPSAVALIEIAPAQESIWPSFTTLRRFFHQTLERFHTYLRELLSQLGLGDGRQDHTKPREIHFSDKLETVVEETSFAHDGQVATPLPSAVALIEIAPAQESIWPSFTALRRFFHQTLERFHTYLRELIGGLPEEWQPNFALHEWSSQMLSFVATVEAVLIVGSVFISQCIVESAFLHSEEELDKVYRKLLNQQNQTRAVENQVKELELQLQVYERERAFQELQVREAQGHLSTIDRKCTERVLNQKRVQELEEARMMQAREELMAHKRKVKKNHQTNSSAEVTLQEEQLSLEIRETRRSRRELAKMKSAMDEVDELVFDSTARCSKSQTPPPETDTHGSQTD
ncbi:uncharacterized protein LOC118214350 [Anguilla anguilla]|uniref:uncharacterized protein LOC118214350 n=1 Tax=Anguilla anguilla TaxID=7936 RepID=UPI0015AF7C3A|nr:uncharacterized protein LOC118214350 [Anguilla anguilla]